MVLEVMEDKGKIKHLESDAHCVICQLALYSSNQLDFNRDSTRSLGLLRTRYAFPFIEKNSLRRTRERQEGGEKTISLHQDEENKVKERKYISMKDSDEGNQEDVESDDVEGDEKEKEDTSPGAEAEEGDEEEEVEVEEEWWIGSFEKFIPRTAQEWEAHEAAVKQVQKDRQTENREARHNKCKKTLLRKESQKDEQVVVVCTGEMENKENASCDTVVTPSTWPDASFYQQHYEFPPYPRTRSIIIKTPCSHVFHQECFASWVERSAQFGTTFCPVCRQPLLIRNGLYTTSLQIPASESVDHHPPTPGVGVGRESSPGLAASPGSPPPPPLPPWMRHVDASPSNPMLAPVNSAWRRGLRRSPPFTRSEEELPPPPQLQTQELGEAGESRRRTMRRMKKDEEMKDWSIIRSRISLSNTLLALRSWENVKMRDQVCKVCPTDSSDTFDAFGLPLMLDLPYHFWTKSNNPRSSSSGGSSSTDDEEDGGGGNRLNNEDYTGITGEEEEDTSSSSSSANRNHHSRQEEIILDPDENREEEDHEEEEGEMEAEEEEEGPEGNTEMVEHFFEGEAWDTDIEASSSSRSSSNNSSIDGVMGFFGSEVLGLSDLLEEDQQQRRRGNTNENIHEEDGWRWDIGRVEEIYQHLNFSQIHSYEDWTNLANRRTLPPLISELEKYFTKRCFIPSVESEEGGGGVRNKEEEEARRDEMVNSLQGLFRVTPKQWDLAKRSFARHLEYLWSLKKKDAVENVNLEELRVKIHYHHHHHHHDSASSSGCLSSSEATRTSSSTTTSKNSNHHHHNNVANKEKKVLSLMNSAEEERRAEAEEVKEEEVDGDDHDGDEKEEKEEASEIHCVYARVREFDEVELTVSVPWSWIRWEEKEEEEGEDERRENRTGGGGGKPSTTTTTSTSFSSSSFLVTAGDPFVDLTVMTVWTKNAIAYNPSQCASCEVIRAYGRRRTTTQQI